MTAPLLLSEQHNACPRCSAPSGQRCTRPDGSVSILPHPERSQALRATPVAPTQEQQALDLAAPEAGR